MSDTQLFEIRLNTTEKGYFNLKGYCSIPDTDLCGETCIYRKRLSGNVELCPYLYFRINASVKE